MHYKTSRWFCKPPPPSFEAVYSFICGRRRVAGARYRMMCLVLMNLYLDMNVQYNDF